MARRHRQESEYVLSGLAVTAHVSRLTPLVHDEHMDGWWKYLVLDMRCLKDEIQARGLNIVIPSAHHGPVATNTSDEEWQDKALLQQSREHRIHRVLQCLAPVSHSMVLPLVCTPGASVCPPQIATSTASALCAP